MVTLGTINQVATPVTLFNSFTHIMQADIFYFKERSHDYHTTEVPYMATTLYTMNSIHNILPLVDRIGQLRVAISK